ncbi:hypothetical protein DV735_g1256, partial [Chaetothyriales sp. CBS 134920]
MPSALHQHSANPHPHSHRRTPLLSQSQPNLTDPSKSSPARPRSPESSLIFLPSTTYARPGTAKPRAAAISSDAQDRLEEQDALPRAAQLDGNSEDPDDFYRAYGELHGQGLSPSLHQDAFGPARGAGEEPPESATPAPALSPPDTARPGTGSRSMSTSDPRLINSPEDDFPRGSRTRKASFRDLVARFDFPKEAPPLPTGAYSSTNSSRKVSPDKREVSYTTTPAKPRRPLFGELAPGPPGALGYGIVQASRRRGSEGSAMHSPNPMFPQWDDDTNDNTDVASQHGTGARLSATRTADEVGASSTHQDLLLDPRPQHRRAHSDLSGTPTRLSFAEAVPPPTGDEARPRHEQPAGRRRRVHSRATSGSRIPVSTGRSTTPDPAIPVTASTGHSLTPESRIPVSTGRSLTPGLDSGPSHTRPPWSPTASNQSYASHSQSGTVRAPPRPKHASPKRRPQPLTSIHSPGRHGRGKLILNGDKSPSLRASIIAPPPKMSPQLRSSRPRLPISAASTASSRAKIAEKIQAMARDQQSSRSFARRARPPELSDVDLKARRLRITQALTRSLEGPDLAVRPVTRPSREPSRELSRKSSRTSSSRQPSPRAAARESLNTTENDGDVFITPDEELPAQGDPFAQHALSALQGQHHFSADGDSPTLGLDEPSTQKLPPPRLDTLQPRRDADPAEISAATHDTVETSATVFDSAEQLTAAHPPRPDLSLLTSIASLREETSASSRSNPPSSSDRQLSDHADLESVNIVLRNTTYLDDEEAVAKGYRPFVPPPVPALPAAYASATGPAASWSFSPQPLSLEPNDDRAGPSRDYSDAQDPAGALTDDQDGDADAESDARVVDQQLVDDLYQRIVAQQPDLADSDLVDPQRVEELCYRELDLLEREWRQSTEVEPQQYNTLAPAAPTYLDQELHQPGSVENVQSPSPSSPKHTLASAAFRAHKYKSSLDSAEDWAETSPSVGDWMKYAANTDEEKANQPSTLSQELHRDDGAGETEAAQLQDQLPPSASDRQRRVSPPLDPVGLPIRPPSHSPPPPPVSKMPSIEQISHHSASTTAFHSPLHDPPAIPPRVGSVSQAPRLSTSSRSLTPRLSTSTRSMTPQGTAMAESGPALEDASSQEQKRLRQRRHVLKELVDTEYTYERDLRVLCDIYKQTAPAALTEDDVKVLFGNIEHIQTFARTFLTYLKQTAKPAYLMERSTPSRAYSSTANAADRMSIRSDFAELSDYDKDRQTRVGQAFLGSLAEMEAVYTEYIRTRHAANHRFEEISTNKAVREWLKECRSNSSDITNAWSLDALLVKPIQRITKYPLLLSELVGSTAPDHPDLGHLHQAAIEITEVNIRINEVKKHTELVDQVMNRKRKESDVRNGLTKAWGRRAEKLKQHVGINETYEDGEFSRLKMDYDNNCIHLFIVSKDCQGYIDALRSWIGRMVEIAMCAEAWVDIGHSNNPVAESKLRQLAMAVRGISTIALPDHVEAVNKKVIAPMDKCKIILERFSLEPKGLIQKREKKLLDYSQAKNKKDRGERLDKRMIERMEQWEAINRETKQRMRKLREATANLVQGCLGVLTHLHCEWFAVVQKKLAAAMALPLDQVASSDIEKDWQVDFDFYEATVLALGICNGSLRNEASNMVSFLAPGSSTLSGEESPRHSSWYTKRSASLTSSSPLLPPGLDALSFRHSSQHPSHHDRGPDSPSTGSFSRMRAVSLASGRVARTTESRSSGVPPLPNPMAFSRPTTSVSYNNSDNSGAGPPRVSLDMPSPSLHASPGYPTHGFTPPQRPGSSQTFFSAVPTPNTSAPNSAGLPAQQQLPYSSGPTTMSDSMAAATAATTQSVPNSPVLFTVASMYEFSIDRTRHEAGLPYLTYGVGEIFDVVGEKGELWMARNQDDPSRTLGWIWCKHFATLGG